jgi:MFS family permease
LFLLPLQLQTGLGHTALYAGLTFTPLAVFFTIGSLIAPRVQPRLGNHVLTVCYAINFVGNVILLFTAIGMGADLSGLALAPALAIVGFGQGMGMSPLLSAALVDVPDRDVGAASGVIQTLMQVGVSFGVTVIGLIFFTVLGDGVGSPDTYSRAFTTALMAQPILALAALLLVPLLKHLKSAEPAKPVAAEEDERLAGQSEPVTR